MASNIERWYWGVDAPWIAVFIAAWFANRILMASGFELGIEEFVLNEVIELLAKLLVVC